MKNLEDELGTVLFEKGNRKMTLTEDGLLLRKRAEDIISEKTTFNKDIYMGCGETDEISMIAKAFISYKIITIFFKHSSRLIKIQ